MTVDALACVPQTTRIAARQPKNSLGKRGVLNFCLVLLLINLPSYGDLAQKRPPPTPEQSKGPKAPGWQLPGLDGKMYELSALRGRVVVLNFWGSWCPPCRVELPHYQKFYERYRDNQSVVVLSINRELPFETKQQIRLARNFAIQYQLTFPVLPDLRGTVTRAYKVRSFPTIYVVDKEGYIRFRQEGYHSGSIQELVEVVDRLEHENQGESVSSGSDAT